MGGQMLGLLASDVVPGGFNKSEIGRSIGCHREHCCLFAFKHNYLKRNNVGDEKVTNSWVSWAVSRHSAS